MGTVILIILGVILALLAICAVVYLVICICEWLAFPKTYDIAMSEQREVLKEISKTLSEISEKLKDEK